jgi:1-acyl-sn-glycerol-3-phosphate acyltransferase
VTILRSLLFNVLFYLTLVVLFLAGIVLLPVAHATAVKAMQGLCRLLLWELRVVAGTAMAVRGLEHVPKGPLLVAGKHQSLWETFALLTLFDDPAMVLKKELTLIPVFGWYIRKLRMIAVERSAGSAALRGLVARAREERAAGRQIIIMPEGTRRAPDDPPDYKPGAAALYAALDVPCVPFGLNAGLFWPRRRFLRHPGVIVVEFLPAIPPGLPRRDFQARLEQAIETSTRQLVAEGRTLWHPPEPAKQNGNN